jgi:hypothetical protein
VRTNAEQTAGGEKIRFCGSHFVSWNVSLALVRPGAPPTVYNRIKMTNPNLTEPYTKAISILAITT